MNLLLFILITAIAVAIYYTYIRNLENVQFIGGCEWPQLKYLCKLTSCAYGSVYYVKNNGENCILIHKKIPVEWVNIKNMDFKSGRMNEIDFYKFVDTLSSDEQQHFVRLYTYRIFKYNPSYSRGNQNEGVQLPYRAEYLTSMRGNSLNSLIDTCELKLNSPQMRNVIGQILKIIKIAGNAGYVIENLRGENITILESVCKLIGYSKIKHNGTTRGLNIMPLLTFITGVDEMFKNIAMLSKSPVKMLSTNDYITYLKSANIWDIISTHTIGDVKTCDVINNTPDTSLPYLTTVSVILYPKIASIYWNRLFPQCISKRGQLVDRKTLEFILDNSSNIDKLIEYFSVNQYKLGTSTFSVNGKDFYDVVAVWGLMKDFNIEKIETKNLAYLLDTPHWGEIKAEISARNVIDNPSKYQDHTARINAANLLYPILVVGNKNIIIADGMHRLAKAVRDKVHYINIQRIPQNVLDATLLFSEK